MAWDYGWLANGTTLATYCSAVILDDESGGGREGVNLRIPNKDGERSDSEQTFAAHTLPLRTVLRWTGPAGTVTHADGAVGHAYENLSELKRLFSAGSVALRRTNPHMGTVEAVCKLMDKPILGEQRHIFIWPLRLLSGSWRSTTQSSQAGTSPTLTVGGDRRIDDPIITFSGAGTVSVTDADGVVSSIQALGACVVNCGLQRVTTGGPGLIIPTQPWWFRFDPGTVNVTSSVSVTITWYDRWA